MFIRSLPGLNWGAEIGDVDLKNASPHEIQVIGDTILKHHVVVIRNQDLKAWEEVNICRQFGSIQKVDALHRCPEGLDGAPIAEVQRVTGMRHPDGTPMGLFGHDHDLDWHANRASNESQREPLIWLYGIQNVSGTRTSWANCTKAFESFDLQFQTELNQLYGIYGFAPNRYTSWNEWKDHRNEAGIKIVRDVLGNGQRSLFFPFLQLFGFKDCTEEYSQMIMEKVKTRILEDPFVYHHDWIEGDVVISDQWNTIHKRWACSVSDRMLHRIAVGWENVLANSQHPGAISETHLSR